MTILHPPAYIPGELCITVGLDPATPPDDCMALVKVAVAADGVSAPASDVPALREVVAQAGRDGIDLKIVEVARNPGMDTALRDVATVVGYDYPDSTVLVVSTNFVGSYSGQFHRSKLEAAEDHAKTGDPVVSAQNFLQELTTPDLPWTALTVVLLAGVAAAAVGTRFLQRRSKLTATRAEAND
ncbi:hypothetical protein BST33_07925 [Mycolicibacter minnesotensis]|uniref:Uncharacterized protein n=1 Tax=Mycolicibacter minnesotensis TaxID=1118379 RepID=A0A7I7RC26_9MYCO|nr:DUF6676 family protein [Mycolicibacter minnesotensis]ORB01586.1 hypothetical protein BST33_07925 [Mycolicibacter minnesotensis]BBY35777.1 hypothetical protein MMIN_38380 [Mycolicibacter minnesotensis]